MDLKIIVIGADMSSESADVSITNNWKCVQLCKERGCPNGGDKKFGYCKWHRSLDKIDQKIKEKWYSCRLCYHGYSDRQALINISKLYKCSSEWKFAIQINEEIKEQRRRFNICLEPICDDFWDHKDIGLKDCDPYMLGFCMECNGHTSGDIWKYG